MIRWLPLLLALVAPGAAGCGKTFLEPNVDTGRQGLYVTAVNPHYGPTSGGNVVTLVGGGFEGNVSVDFGNATVAGTVLDTHTVTVTAPDAGMELVVDLAVRSDLGEIVLSDGYTFTDGEPPDDPYDTGETGETDISGVGGVIEFSHLHVACTSCFDPPADQVQVYAFAAFHHATASTWTEWMPDPGSCLVDPSSVQPTSSFLDIGQNVHLVAGSSSVTLTRTTVSGQVQYDAGALGDADFMRNTAYDLEAADGGSWGPFTVVDAVTTGQNITSISPIELLYTQPNQAFQPALSRSGTTISYAPYGGTGSFLVLLGVYNPQGSSYLGSVVCREYDNGSLSIPSSVLSSYPSGSLVVVYMYRYIIEWTPNPAAGSYLESVVSHGVLGTASLR
jgi:hypothetical protein